MLIKLMNIVERKPISFALEQVNLLATNFKRNLTDMLVDVYNNNKQSQVQSNTFELIIML